MITDQNLQKKKARNVIKRNLRKSVSPSIWLTIESLIREDYSPEQVVGHCKKNKGTLYQHLRRKGRIYKKRGAINTGRGQIPDRVSIDKRPSIVDKKLRFGDLEADTIVGKDHKGAIVTLNDRASGMLKMKKIKTREATEVRIAINEMLEEWIPYINTITADNGKEFTEHKKVSKGCHIDFYFANPYSPWERGANENLNGLIRQYFPKKTDFSTIPDQEIKRIERKLNDRPRKRHKFDTPLEVMEKLLFNTKVAFIT